MLRVVCWLWKDERYRWNHLFRYGPKHVNILRNMVARHLRLEHEFVCICDDPAGIDAGVRIVPLWDDLRQMGGCYTRLKAFSPEMADVIGPRFAWLDVDCVIVDDITPLFDRDDDFVMWRNAGRTPYCGSMVMMNAGARREVWDDFDPQFSPESSKALGYIGTDQAWIATRLGAGEAVWTKEDGVYSRNGVIRSKLPGRVIRTGGTHLPKSARIVFFHGPFDPSQPLLQETAPWICEHWH